MKKFLLIVTILFTVAAHSQNQTRNGLPSDVQSAILKFYPNPATTVITFNFEKAYDKGYSLQIYNAVLGRKMTEQTNIPDRFTLDLSNYTRGVYVYQLRDKTGKLMETGKFQVSK